MKSKKIEVKRRLIAQALSIAFTTGIASTALVNSAYAQSSGPAERIVVTGSQIPRAEKETPSPVQVISAEELKNSGYTTVSEVLRDITANGQGTLTQGFNQAFAGGASGVSLRGLTVGATLVLIDGHRMAPYPLSDDGQRAFVDISSIPFAAVERVEILKDGASAVYGSDAMAGVVNVILKKSFEGTFISGETGKSQHGGGATSRASIMQGFGKLGEGNSGYLALEYRHQDQIKLDQRSGPWTNFDWTSQGGGNLNPGIRNAFTTTPRVQTPYLQIPGSSSTNAANFVFLDANCTHAKMRAGQCGYTNTWAQIQPESENINLLGSLTSKLADGWELNLKGSYFDSKNQQTRYGPTVPAGSFAGNTAIGPGLTPSIVGAIGTNQYTVPASYPGNTLGVPAIVRALVPGISSRVEDIESKSTRLVAELSGTLSGWDVKGSAGYTKVETAIAYNGYINYANLYTALNSTSNPFLLTGGNSAAMMAFVSPITNSKATDELNFLEARGTRELMPLPGGPLSIGVGASYVQKKLSAPNSPESQDGSVYTSGAYALGKDTNTSLYVEFVAPVLKVLELDGAVRVDHYDTYGNSTTPKLGFKFTPIREVAIRGTASKGFRAPSATENGNAGALFSFNQINDPVLCPGGSTTVATNAIAYCRYTPTYLQTTTKDLKPEESKSYTLGLILEPIKGWATTLDYYKITVDNQIIPAAQLANYDPIANAVRGTPQTVSFGDGTTGPSSVGPIQYIKVPYINGQTTETSGVELETRYKFNLADYGNLTVGLQISHMFKYDMTLNGSTYKLAGTHGPAIVSGDTGNPKNRAQLTLIYDKGPFTITSTTNYVSGYDMTDPSNGINDCTAGLTYYNSQWYTVDPPTQYCKTPSFTYTNLSMQYRMDKAWTLHGSITNLFDKQPPIDMQTYGGTGSNANSGGTGSPYNPSLHQIGAVGRFFNIGASYKF